jgi:hypothetical protein
MKLVSVMEIDTRKSKVACIIVEPSGGKRTVNVFHIFKNPKDIVEWSKQFLVPKKAKKKNK